MNGLTTTSEGLEMGIIEYSIITITVFIIFAVSVATAFERQERKIREKGKGEQ